MAGCTFLARVLKALPWSTQAKRGPNRRCSQGLAGQPWGLPSSSYAQ